MTYTRLLSHQGRPYLCGEDIRHVQMALSKAGFCSGRIDGIYGPKTAKAVKAYQDAGGLQADGIVGPKTWNALFNTNAASSGSVSSLRRNDAGEDVKLLQSLLNKFGFDCGFEAGIFGAKTDVALRLFQRKMKLCVDGICGSKTWRTLQAASLERFKLWGFVTLLHQKDYPFMVRQFQAAMGLKPDAKVGAKTLAALGQDIIIPRFFEDDMKCQCGGKYCTGRPAGEVSIGVRILAERLMRVTENTQANTGFFIPNRKTPAPNGAVAGGYRCAKWNKERGGALSSRHKKGIAVDIGHKDAKIRNLLEKYALSMNKHGGVGYGARYIVHIDLDGKRRWRY